MAPRNASPSGRPLRQPSFAISTPRLGLYVLFGSLSMLFGSTLVGYFVTRADAPVWRPVGAPGLPSGLWVSSALVVGISAALEAALIAARKNRLTTVSRRLAAGTVFAVLFLLMQALNWFEMHQSVASVEIRTLRLDTFYLLTGLHAAHVLGGLVPLGIVLLRNKRKEYSSSRHEGMVLCVQYWHYLSIVWVVLFVTLKLGSG